MMFARSFRVNRRTVSAWTDGQFHLSQSFFHDTILLKKCGLSANQFHIFKEDFMNKNTISRGKALLGLLLAVMMILSCASALGEAGPGTKEFDDMIVTWPENSYIQVGTKAVGEILFTIFPDYDNDSETHPNLNCAWSSEVVDFSILTDDLLVPVAESMISQAKSALEAQNIIVESMKVVSAEMAEVGGKKAYSYTYSSDLDYSKLGMELKANVYSKIYLVSDENLKSYNFTLTSFGDESIPALDQLLQDSVTFK